MNVPIQNIQNLRTKFYFFFLHPNSLMFLGASFSYFQQFCTVVFKGVYRVVANVCLLCQLSAKHESGSASSSSPRKRFRSGPTLLEKSFCFILFFVSLHLYYHDWYFCLLLVVYIVLNHSIITISSLFLHTTSPSQLERVRQFTIRCSNISSCMIFFQ